MNKHDVLIIEGYNSKRTKREHPEDLKQQYTSPE